MSYQDRDRAVVDYAMWAPGPAGVELRGPRPEAIEPGQYIACVGAAQTFGCFCERPWPQRIADSMGMPVLNLGVAGAGPRHFLGGPFVDWIRDSACVVVQVMSGRSEDNSVFQSDGLETLTRRDDGRALPADRAWEEELGRDVAGIPWTPLRKVVARGLSIVGRRRVRELVAETRRNWIDNTAALLALAEGKPSALFWFSVRSPSYRPDYRSAWRMFGDYPQLVDEAMVGAVRAGADAYVEVVSRRGMPQRLVSRDTGEPVALDTGRVDETGQKILWTHNDYYPSPEMHADAAAALEPELRRLLGR